MLWLIVGDSLWDNLLCFDCLVGSLGHHGRKEAHLQGEEEVVLFCLSRNPTVVVLRHDWRLWEVVLLEFPILLETNSLIRFFCLIRCCAEMNVFQC